MNRVYRIAKHDLEFLRRYYHREVFTREEGDLSLVRLSDERATFVRNKLHIQIQEHEQK